MGPAPGVPYGTYLPGRSTNLDPEIPVSRMDPRPRNAIPVPRAEQVSRRRLTTGAHGIQRIIRRTVSRS